MHSDLTIEYYVTDNHMFITFTRFHCIYIYLLSSSGKIKSKKLKKLKADLNITYTFVFGL